MNYNLFLCCSFSIINFLIVYLSLNFVNYKIGMKLLIKDFSKHNDFLFLEVSINHKEKKLKKWKFDYFEECYIAIYKTKMFNSICFFNLKSYDKLEFKKSRKSYKKFIKNKYQVTKCTNVTKPHWNIKGEILVLDEVDFENLNLYLPQRKFKAYEVGQIRCVYHTKSSKIIIPYYKDEGLNIISFKKYLCFVKMLYKLFTITSVDE